MPQPGAIALGRISSISEIVIAFTAVTSGIGCYTFSDRLLCDTSGRNQRTRGLADDGSNFIEVLKEVVSNLQDRKVRQVDPRSAAT